MGKVKGAYRSGQQEGFNAFFHIVTYELRHIELLRTTTEETNLDDILQYSRNNTRSTICRRRHDSTTCSVHFIDSDGITGQKVHRRNVCFSLTANE
jgi:hypothetical protein